VPDQSTFRSGSAGGFYGSSGGGAGSNKENFSRQQTSPTSVAADLSPVGRSSPFEANSANVYEKEQYLNKMRKLRSQFSM
jgi:hypothetical protein